MAGPLRGWHGELAGEEFGGGLEQVVVVDEMDGQAMVKGRRPATASTGGGAAVVVRRRGRVPRTC
jgi:hypothetical protein